jgi:hypothetical protein
MRRELTKECDGDNPYPTIDAFIGSFWKTDISMLHNIPCYYRSSLNFSSLYSDYNAFYLRCPFDRCIL